VVRPGRALLGWAIGVLMTIGLVTGTGGWYEHRWYPPDECGRVKASAVNVEGFEIVPGQPDPCYLRRPRIRPWQWTGGASQFVRAIRGG
jgi:hypothetical protein